jgi:FtsP/CotA-like multicopper oxidase with cupredoxin domain
MTAIGGAAAVVPRYLRSAPAIAAVPEPFTVPLVVPPVLRPTKLRDGRDLYTVTMRRAEVQILKGKRTPIWGFNGRFPGPTIKVTKGEPVVVRQVNRLRTETTIHLHGGHVSPHDDGGPLDTFDPGSYKDYHYPNQQEAATLWYHDHTHHATSRNVYKGLAGLYIIEDPNERELNLPRGRYDIPLMIQDRSFNKDGSFRFRNKRDDVLGDVYLVNGKPVPYFKVANRRYRFRILNASNSRGYTLALDTGLPLTQIASDGGLLPSPVLAPSIALWPAERAEVIIDFSTYPVGTSVTLQDRSAANPMDALPVMRFDVDREEEDGSTVPTTLRPIDPLPAGEVEREFELRLDASKGDWLINGRTFSPDRIDVRPKLGTVETWTFNNVSALTHPMHVHLVMFQVLDRDDVPAMGGDSGWKDTVAVAPGEKVRVAMRFEDHTGRYVFHCHNLAHEDHGMMAQMKVTK